jgi:bifunctional DNA-binding transcriptional regulator/antitoxin component of YhaV-PrlF toxin-antitoxin module
MSLTHTVQVGQTGDVPIPLPLRQAAGIDEGALVTLEAQDGTIIIRPATSAIEEYSPARQAEFLLSNAVDAADYKSACEEVQKLGLDPNSVPHYRPAGA